MKPRLTELLELDFINVGGVQKVWCCCTTSPSCCWGTQLTTVAPHPQSLHKLKFCSLILASFSLLKVWNLKHSLGPTPYPSQKVSSVGCSPMILAPSVVTSGTPFGASISTTFIGLGCELGSPQVEVSTGLVLEAGILVLHCHILTPWPLGPHPWVLGQQVVSTSPDTKESI